MVADIHLAGLSKTTNALGTTSDLIQVLGHSHKFSFLGKLLKIGFPRRGLVLQSVRRSLQIRYCHGCGATK